jgi:LemA protein
MTTIRSGWLSAAVLTLVGLGAPGCAYNTLTTQQEAIKGAWAEVNNQLQRRNDLVPNLVATVQGFAEQEREILTRIAASRERLAGARTPEETMAAANEQSSALSRLLVVVENYPQLKSNETFMRLMDELSGTENRIAVARGRYNEQVQSYNALRRRFPTNMTAGMFGFEEWQYFEAPPAATEVPRVDFSR